MHLVQVPIVLGRGVRVWDGLEALEDAYDVEAVSTPSGVTHLTFTREGGPDGAARILVGTDAVNGSKACAPPPIPCEYRRRRSPLA